MKGEVHLHKIERLMGIVLALNRNKKMTANELARKFEVDIRTIYRDIQALSELNIPVISGVGYDGGYSLPEDFFIPPVMFNKDELFSLLLSKKVIGETGIPGYSEYINSAFLKIETAASDKLLDAFHGIEKKVKFGKKDKTFYPHDFKYFTVIKDGLEHNQKIRIKYQNPENNDMMEIVICPYGLLYVDDVWMVVSFCEKTHIIESLEINLIRDAELIEEIFCMPLDFNLDDYYCSKHCIVKCKEQRTDIVKLKVDKASYNKIKDYIYFNDCEVIDDGQYNILPIRSSNPESYIKIAFKFYDKVEILEPLWLREAFLNELKRLCNIYEK